MRQPEIVIDGRPVGIGHAPYIVAEMSGNHNGDLGRAIALIDAAAEAGADAVKMQTYTPDTITIDHAGPDFVIAGGLWHGRTLYDLYREAHTPWDWHPRLFAHARKRGITIFSTPFDDSAVELLEGLDCPAYKVASLEIVDLPLIRCIAATGKPVIISTGAATAVEIGEAVKAARDAGSGELILLHCVSGYPTPADEINLRTMADLAKSFGCTVGLSDHTMGVGVAVAAVALGAVVIEKHFTLKRADGGPDSAFSLEARELAQLVDDCTTAWCALGKVDYSLKASEAGNRDLRRSLYAVADIAADEVLTKENIRSIRPGFGLAPKHLGEILGRRACQAIARGTPLGWALMADDQDTAVSA